MKCLWYFLGLCDRWKKKKKTAITQTWKNIRKMSSKCKLSSLPLWMLTSSVPPYWDHAPLQASSLYPTVYTSTLRTIFAYLQIASGRYKQYLSCLHMQTQGTLTVLYASYLILSQALPLLQAIGKISPEVDFNGLYVLQCKPMSDAALNIVLLDLLVQFLQHLYESLPVSRGACHLHQNVSSDLRKDNFTPNEAIQHPAWIQ